MLAQAFHEFSTGAMGVTSAAALHAAIAGYLVAALIALVALFAPARARMAWADWTGGFATGALLVYFGARFTEAGMAPLQSLFEVIALSALCLALAYFVATRLKPMPALGGFAFPALALVFLVSLPFASGLGAPDTGGPSPLIVLHVLLTVLAYGVFFMAAVAAFMFLAVERALKRHQAAKLVRTFPPLESLRRLIQRCVLIGLPVLSVGFALGFVGTPVPEWPALLATPKVITALVLWLVLLGAAVGRAVGWLHGRRHSWLILAGFGLVLATYVGLGLFVAAEPKPLARATQENVCTDT